jgi:DNA-binding response OmpR family regulator
MTNGHLAGAADAVLPKPYHPAQVLAAADALLTRKADQT